MFPVMTGALVRIDPFTFTSLRYLLAGAARCMSEMCLINKEERDYA